MNSNVMKTEHTVLVMEENDDEISPSIECSSDDNDTR